MKQSGVGLLGRSVDKHAGVEAVGPANIRSCGQLLTFKQVVNILKNLHVAKPALYFTVIITFLTTELFKRFHNFSCSETDSGFGMEEKQLAAATDK